MWMGALLFCRTALNYLLGCSAWEGIMRPDTKGWAGGWGSTRARFTMVGTNICPAAAQKYCWHQEVRQQ